MSAHFFTRGSGWLMLPAAILGFAGAWCLRPDQSSDGRPPAPPTMTSAPRPAAPPPGPPRSLPQTERRLEALWRAGLPSQQIAAVLEWENITSLDEIKDLLKQSWRFPSHSAEETGKAVLLKRWLALDPDGALAYCTRQHADFLPRLIATWGHADPDKAAAWVLEMPQGDARSGAWLSLCAVAAARDPEQAWTMLERAPGVAPGTNGWNMESTLRTLVSRDPEKAIARLATFPPSLTDAVERAIASELMKTDPDRAWAWVRQLPRPEQASAAALAVAIRTDPARSLSFIKSLPPGDFLRISQNHGHLLESGNAAAFADALRREAGMDESSRLEIADSLFNTAVWNDAAASAALLPLMSETAALHLIRNYTAGGFQGDRKAALDWVETLPEGPLRDAGETALATLSEASARPAPNSPESLIEDMKIFQFIREGDARLSRLTADQVRQALTSTEGGLLFQQGEFLTKLAASHPEPAAAWLETTVINHDTGPLAAQFSASWAQADPVAAATWVTQLPAGDLAVNAAANVAREYHRYAPAAAAAWMNALPSGPVREAARKAVEGN